MTYLKRRITLPQLSRKLFHAVLPNTYVLTQCVLKRGHNVLTGSQEQGTSA
jgi:hypothetical protein